MRLLFSVLICTTCLAVFGQSNEMLRPDILPKSPEAAAFAKNINIPIGYTSGTPQIAIPLASIKSGSIELPISLSYNASGIRVEEVPTWVGLGWNLSAGGQVTRTVRMLPDESSYVGFYNVPGNRKIRYIDSAFCWCASDPPLNFELEVGEEARDMLIDLEPDTYNFSVLGYSGEFYYNQDSGRHILVPFQNIKIESYIDGFVLVLPDGVRASFGTVSSAVEVMQSGTTRSYIDGVSQDEVSISNSNYPTSWMLTELSDPRGKKIQFNYQTEYILTFGRGGERFGVSFLDASERQSFYKQYITRPLLTSIKAESGNVYFKKSAADRLDMVPYPYGSKSLDTVIVTTKENISVKSYSRLGFIIHN